MYLSLPIPNRRFRVVKPILIDAKGNPGIEFPYLANYQLNTEPAFL